LDQDQNLETKTSDVVESFLFDSESQKIRTQVWL